MSVKIILKKETKTNKKTKHGTVVETPEPYDRPNIKNITSLKMITYLTLILLNMIEILLKYYFKGIGLHNPKNTAIKIYIQKNKEQKYNKMFEKK